MLYGKSKDHVASNLAVCLALTATLAAFGAAHAAAPYPAMAPVGQYMMGDRSAEIALARSAAAPSVSAQAEVLVLGPQGYVPAASGTNGFVCLVQRAWFSGLQDDGFWNPKTRAPICFNPQGARSVLPTFLKRTSWALAGLSRDEILARTREDLAAGRIRPAEAGVLGFMMSKQGYLNDDAAGPWHPHLMFFTPPMPLTDWGANEAGTRVLGAAPAAGADPYSIFFVPVAAWSDGTPDANPPAPHRM
jgi:hypothetical protein